MTIPAKGKGICLTDLQVRVPPGCYGRVAPRSGLAAKHFIDVGGMYIYAVSSWKDFLTLYTLSAGVIDEDYRGNVGVVLFNHSDVDFEVNEGDRIAQLICEKISYPTLKEVDKLDDTSRGSNGFGSTGMSWSKKHVHGNWNHNMNHNMQKS